MRKHPEVFALLFLGVVWSIGSLVIPARAEMNRIMVLNSPDRAVIERIENCPAEKIRVFRAQVCDRIHSEMRHEVRSAVHELKDALHSLH
jgi:hypothetical protein